MHLRAMGWLGLEWGTAGVTRDVLKGAIDGGGGVRWGCARGEGVSRQWRGNRNVGDGSCGIGGAVVEHRPCL